MSSSGIVSGALTVAGGDVILDNAASVSGLTALSYILAATKTNDILVAVNWGTWSPGAAAYSLNLDNAAAGFYILADGVDLSGLKNKTFAVTDNGQNVNVQVGSSYTFNNSSKLSLSYTDSTHDQLIAVLAAQPEVSIAATDADAGEPANNGTFRISRTGDTSIALTVYFNIGGTATGGSDYTLNNGSTTLSNSVVIAAGQSSADVTLNVIDDTIVEKTETAIMSLTADPGYNLGAANSSTINITDNDDNTPPNVPDGLTVTPNGKNVAFDWADCSDSGSGLKNYLLEYALNEQFTGAVQDSITVSNANVSGLAEGVYFWRVQASDNFGNTSDWAPGGSFVIDTTAPSVPTMLTQTVTKSSKTVTFDWAKATDATSGVKQYEVQIDTGSNFNSLINTLISTTNEATAIGLSEGHYYWRVKTMDNSNNWSDWSSAFGFTVDTTAPAVPATLTPVITVNNVALDWTDSSDATSGLKNYLLQYALNDQFTGAVQRSITASNANVSGLADGVYYWRVQSVDNSDNGSDWITGDKFTVDTTKPNVPGGLTNTPDGKSVTLDWNAASDATSGVKQYEIQVDNNINFNSLDAFKRVAGNQVSVDNLSAGTYYWRVRAQDNSGNLGDWSSPASFILELIPPTVPGGLKQTVTGSSVAFNWTASTDASSIRQYQIQVDNNSNFSSPEYSATLAASATPTAGDSLTTGTYYWQVRAQDKAGNWSAWSKSSSFTVTPPDIGANTWQLAKDIANPVNLDNWVGFNDSADVYKLSMTRAGTLTLGLTGLSGNADLSLLSSAGAVLKTSLNPGTAPEAINNAALLTGTYYVKVAAGTGVTNAAYTLSNTINYFDGDSIDMAGNTTAAAKVVSGSSQTSGWVGFGDPADYYKLTMTGAGTLTLNLTGLSSDANLTLYDAKGKQLNTSNNKNIADENIINPALPGGDYYIKIAPADGGKSTVNNTGYTLKNTISYFAGDTIDNAGNTIVTAKLVDASLPAQSGWVGLGDSDDYYRFAVAASTQSTLRLDMAGGNADLSLYDSNGKLLQKSAKTGTSEDMITRNLTAGIYYARVNAVSGSNIDYTLTFDKKALAGILAS